MSVIIPAARRDEMLEACLESLARQTARGFEAIVVYDGPAAVRGRAPLPAFPFPLREFVLARPRGPAACRNRGVRAARGSWLAFLDADDEWLPAKLARQLSAARRRPGALFLHGGYRSMSHSGRRLRRREPMWMLPFLRRRWRLKNGICTSSVILRRSLWRKVGPFDESFHAIHDDTELWARIALATRPGRILFLPRPLVLRRAHPRQVTRGLPRKWGEGDYSSPRAKAAGMDLLHLCRKYRGTAVLEPA